MSKEHDTMGRKSLKAQDAHKNQHLADLGDQLPEGQPTRPYVNPQRANKSSKPGQKDTK